MKLEEALRELNEAVGECAEAVAVATAANSAQLLELESCKAKIMQATRALKAFRIELKNGQLDG